MRYKIFISHKQEDHQAALKVEKILKQNDVDTYLDLLDNSLSGDGEKLTAHIKEKLRECTDLIVILSENTKKSWWVPFEIGMASEKDIPIANYLLDDEKLPDYLNFWPRLKKDVDVENYVVIRKQVARKVSKQRSLNEGYNHFSSNESETTRFYNELKKKL